MSNANKKKQEEKHLRLLRECLARTDNKRCFDCGQRGPTYADMTTGAFVCTSCSGILRGLPTPHRVKSVSMATFTPTEIDWLLERGNRVCRSIWLGRCDEMGPNDGYIFETGKDVRDMMISKYEKKLYYVPEETARARLKETIEKTHSTAPTNTNEKSSINTAVERPKLTNSNRAQSIDIKPIVSTPIVASPITKPKEVLDTSVTQVSSDFANWTVFESEPPSTIAKAETLVPTVKPEVKDPINWDPFSNETESVNASIFPSDKSAINFQSPLLPTNVMSSDSSTSATTLNPTATNTSTPVSNQQPVVDKYAALASLDDAFKSGDKLSDWSVPSHSTSMSSDWGGASKGGSVMRPQAPMNNSTFPANHSTGYAPTQMSNMNSFAMPNQHPRFATNPFETQMTANVSTADGFGQMNFRSPTAQSIPQTAMFGANLNSNFGGVAPAVPNSSTQFGGWNQSQSWLPQQPMNVSGPPDMSSVGFGAQPSVFPQQNFIQPARPPSFDGQTPSFSSNPFLTAAPNPMQATGNNPFFK